MPALMKLHHHDGIINYVQQCMNFDVDEAAKIQQGKKKIPPEGLPSVIAIQNSTATLVITVVDPKDGTMTIFDPPGLCLDRRVLAEEIYLRGSKTNKEAKLDIGWIKSAIPSANQDIKNFPATNITFKYPPCTVSMFTSCTCVASGEKMASRVEQTSMNMKVLLNNLHSKEPAYNVTVVADAFSFIQNIVVSSHVGHAIDLTLFHRKYPTLSSYNPKEFVAIIVTLKDVVDPDTGLVIRRIKFLLFGSGNKIQSGSSNMAQVKFVNKILDDMVAPFKTLVKPKTPRGRQALRWLSHYRYMTGDY